MAKTTTKANRAAKSKPASKRAKAPKKPAKAMRTAKASAPRSSKKAGKKGNQKIKKTANRRKYRRHVTPNLWVTELNGDYRFVVRAENMSEGGVFLRGRLKDAATSRSTLSIPIGRGETLEVEAAPLHDRVTDSSCGTGYEFVDVSQAQGRLLRGFLRDLD